MISVIIPTMWKPPHIERMLPILESNSLIGEIILIDNDVSKTNHALLKKIKKLVYYSFEAGNIYVNPAWNHGAKVAKFDKLFLLNDDCLVNLNSLQKIYDQITPERGIFGFSEESYCSYNPEAFRTLCSAGFGNDIYFEMIDPRDYKKLTGMPHIHYGSPMFMHKKNYHEIPSQFRIYYGDLFVYIKNLSNEIGNYQIHDGLVMSKVSSTVSVIGNKILLEETKMVKDVFKEFGLENIKYKIRKDL